MGKGENLALRKMLETGEDPRDQREMEAREPPCILISDASGWELQVEAQDEQTRLCAQPSLASSYLLTKRGSGKLANVRLGREQTSQRGRHPSKALISFLLKSQYSDSLWAVVYTVSSVT